MNYKFENLNEIRKGKKWKTNGVSHGQKGVKISPGTSRGDAYCARSAGIKKNGRKMHCAGKDKNTPNCLSRRKWKCRGKKSLKEVTINLIKEVLNS